MKILVKKSTSPTAWYADKIGQTLSVIRFESNRHPAQGIPEDVYWCREGGTYNALNYVRKSDCVEVD